MITYNILVLIKINQLCTILNRDRPFIADTRGFLQRYEKLRPQFPGYTPIEAKMTQ